MRKKSVLLSSTVFWLCFCINIYAQDAIQENNQTPNEIIDEKMEQVNTSFADLSKRVNDLESQAKMTVSCVVFTNYTYDLTSTAIYNNYFDVTRGYINLRKKVSDQVSLRLTPDFSYRMRAIQGSTTKGGGIESFLKYAYMDVTVMPNQIVTFGLMETTWMAFLEKVWANRYIAKTLPDMRDKIATSDLGVKWTGLVLGGMLDYTFGIINGEGYRDAEVSKFKDIGLRLTFVPLPADLNLKGLKLSTFYQQGYGTTIATRRIKSDYLLSFQHEIFTAGAEYLSCVDEALPAKTDSYGYSLFGFWNIIPQLQVLLRYDRWDANLNTLDNTEYFTLLGVSYELATGVKLCLNNQQAYKEAGGGVFDNKINLNTIYEF